MSNRLFYLLVMAMLLCAPLSSDAAFVVKKQEIATSEVVTTTALAQEYNSELSSAMTATTASEFPRTKYPLFIKMLVSGWVGRLAFIFGLLGLLSPLFSVGAVLFGFLGMGKYRKSKGLAVAGLILGLIGIIAVALGGFTVLPIF